MTYHLAGDSTVAACPPEEHPMSGWGPHLTGRVDSPVRNLAFGGATTKSFMESGRWAELIDGVAAGDTVIIQFGHNDQKHPGVLDARGGYADRLRTMVLDVRRRSALPILCTSAERRWFEDGRITPTHGGYPDAVRDLAHEMDCPLIDLTVFTTWLYEDLGPEASRRLLSHHPPGSHPRWPEGLADDTHFHQRGAEKIAAFVAASLRAIERKDGDQPARGAQLPR
jgi:lysophospholipase L1-like esterase